MCFTVKLLLFSHSTYAGKASPIFLSVQIGGFLAGIAAVALVPDAVVPLRTTLLGRS